MIDKDDLEIAKSAYTEVLKSEEDYYLKLYNDNKSKEWNKGWTAGLSTVVAVVNTLLNHSEAYDTIYKLMGAINGELIGYLYHIAKDDSYLAGKEAAISNEMNLLFQTLQELFDPDDEVVENGDEDEV